MRRVVLDREWWKTDSGPLIAARAGDGSPVALLQPRAGVYDLVDPADGARTRVDEAVAATLSPTATMLYRALPVVPVTGREVLAFVLRPLRGDLGRLVVYGLIAAALSLVTPIVTKQIFSDVVPGLERGNLLWYSMLLGVFAVATFGFAVAQQLALTRIEARAAGELQAALWDRVLDLPLPFFRRFSAGGLAMRVMGIEQIRTLANAAVATAALAVPLGLANLALAFVLQWRLALFGSVVIVAIAGGLVALVRYQVARQQEVQTSNQELFGTALELVDAVGKLRVADAERRGFVQWARRFGAMKRSFYDAQLGFVALTAGTAAATALGTVMLFVGAATLGVGAVDGATFIAFNGAYLQALTAVVGLSTVATFVAQAVPIYDNVRPVLEATRETEAVRSDPGELRGQIDVAHMSLRYDADAPLVLDDVTLSVSPGEFVALVGPSGSGKSTLMRVLLGFEKPEVGSVRLDGRDIESLDPRAVRRQIGVVLQSAGLLPGDVFTNVVGTRELTMEDAWEAVRIAGLEADIKALPMGMHTFVAEGASTFSGGQRQRLLIARAVAGRPRILLFDEATSALDNRTQAEVSEAISRLRATRIVIAHRLSTVRHADRILVLAGGRIVQEGTFAALMDTPGPFQDLARRQLV
jgi:ATP-binding cassette subfamily C protein